jgi:hypothetical protein
MKLKKLLFIIVIVIVLTELGLMIFLDDRLRVRQIPLCYAPDSLMGYTYIPNSVAEIKWPGINHKFRINNHGFYGPDFEERKKDGVYRICIIGSSISNGMWSNGDKDYPIFLQQLFTDNNLKHVEIINCAIDGGRRFMQEVNLAKYITEKYTPDLILLSVIPDTKWRFYSRKNYRGYQLRYSPFSEKAESIAKAKIDKLCSPKFQLIKKIYNASYIIRFVFRGIHYEENMTSGIKFDLRALLEKQDHTENHIYYYLSLQAFEGLLASLNTELQAKGTKLVLIEFGSSELMRQIAKKSQLDMLSLRLDLAEYRTKYDGHPTQEGHLLIAQELYKMLLDKTIISNNYLQQQKYN